jgi:PAS domain S-box-containing protein
MADSAAPIARTVAEEKPASWSRPQSRRALLGLAAVLAAPGAVTLLAFAHPRPVIPALLYIVAIMLATIAGGRWAGLAAAIASLVPFLYFFTTPQQGFSIDAEAFVAIVVFGLTGIFGSEAIARQRESRERAERAVRTSKQALEVSRRLQRVADALASSLTAQQVLDAVLSEGVEAAQARGGLIAMLSDDGESLEIVASRGYDQQWLEPFARFPVAGDYPLSEAVRTGEPVFLSSEAERDGRYPELIGRSQPGHGLVCLPLVVEDRTIGGLVFSFGSDQEFTPERRALKVALARQAAVALERSRLVEAERTLRGRLSFLGEATAILGSSLDYETTLQRLAELAVPLVADWCTIDLLGPDGRIDRLVVAHPDPERRRWAEQLQIRTDAHIDDDSGVARVLRTGEPEFVPEIPADLLEQAAAANPAVAELLSEVHIRGWICVPLSAGVHSFAALTLVAEGDRLLTEADFEIAQELAARAAVAVENARLYREAERRADAALALEYVGDGVVLLDRAGRVRYWNTAVAAVTGVDERDAVGRRITEVLPAWEELSRHVELADADAPERARPVTVPFSAGGHERWLAVAGVAFDAGTVYAIRDVSEERALAQARDDFVATASHELRTPLAAVYGAARTLRRGDLDLLPEQRDTFLQIIEDESERLTTIVSQILLAGQLDDGRIDVSTVECELDALAASVVASAQLRAPEGVDLGLVTNGGPWTALADADKLRQVLVNLVDNAVKYSPGGGKVTVELERSPGRIRIAVRDRGLGIPAEEQQRIFEKFYRLDPTLTRGVGGSGLGLYISQELVTRMGGRLTVESAPGAGSVFRVDLPSG